MLMQAKNAVGSNTPGAASSAADLEAQEAPKSMPQPQKIDVEKQHVLGSMFSWFRPCFGRLGGSFLEAKMHAVIV